MKYESIADIYSANQKIDDGFQSLLATISDADAHAEIPGEKWTIAALVEHVAIVEFNMAKICAKLAAAAKESGKASDGTFAVSSNFAEKSVEIADVKLDAPEMVHPIGGVPIAESIEKLKASNADLEALRPVIESFDVSGSHFPHPFIGNMTAAEWLLLAGGHKMRHIRQIQNLLAKVRA